MKLISIVTPTFNEEENVKEIYWQVKKVITKFKKYDYEHIFIDNASTDKTVSLLKKIAQKDKKVKIIVNSRNFGWIRSPFYGLLQAKGDGVILIASDLQEPPALIANFISKWEEGNEIVMGVKSESEENGILFYIRQIYYRFLKNIAEIELVNNFVGFGLFDKKIIEILKKINDPYPYLRGIIAEIGFSRTTVSYKQPKRKNGKSNGSFYKLFDVALLGITSYSKLPLRLMTMTGFCLSVISLLGAIAYLIYKLIFWGRFSLGMAPLVIGLFFFSSVQLLFSGIIGEYIGVIHTRTLRRPLVIEKERINF